MKTTRSPCRNIILALCGVIQFFVLNAFGLQWHDEITGLNWTYRISDGVIIGDGSTRAIQPVWGGRLVVPSEIDGKPVKRIAAYAFSECQFTSAEIPNTVVAIGDYAFQNCTELEEIHLPKLESMGEKILYNCKSDLKIYSEGPFEKWPLWKKSTRDYGCKTVIYYGVSNPAAWGWEYTEQEEDEDYDFYQIKRFQYVGAVCADPKSSWVPGNAYPFDEPVGGVYMYPWDVKESAFYHTEGTLYEIRWAIWWTHQNGGVLEKNNFYPIVQKRYDALIGISPEPRTVFENRMAIELFPPHEDVELYYTIDGSDPVSNGVKYVQKFSIRGKTTVRAVGYYRGVLATKELVAHYGSGIVDAPVIMASQESFNFSKNRISISCATPNVEIHFTTDGTEPTALSPIYSVPFTIDETTTVKAVAIGHPDYIDSEVATRQFTRTWLTVPTPVISPGDGSGFDTVKGVVSIGCDIDGVTIYFTTDGSKPSRTSDVYCGQIEIDDDTTIQAYAVKDDYLDSPVVKATIYNRQPYAETPVISLADGGSSFVGSFGSVVMMSATEGATIHYTLDGTDPNEHSPIYSGPVSIVNTTIVKAYASKVGCRNSAVVTATFKKQWAYGDSLNCPDIMFKNDGGDWVNDPNVSYDGNGSLRSPMNPQDGKEYSFSTEVSGSQSVSFYWKTSCEKDEWDEFYYDHAEFWVDDELVAQLDGVDADWQLVEHILCPGAKHRLCWRYVKDESGKIGNDCVWIDALGIIPIVSGRVPPPVVNPSGVVEIVGSEFMMVEMTSKIPNVTICYTLDGSSPALASAMVYDGAFRVDVAVGHQVEIRAIAKKKGLGDSEEVSVILKNFADEIVRFDAGRGVCVESFRRVGHDGKIGPLPSANATGYEFVGWFTQPEGGVAVGDDYIVTGDTTLFAHWQVIAYKINYRLEGGVNNPQNPLTYTIEDEISFAAPTYTGYDFVGWDPDGMIPRGSTGDKTISARWKKGVSVAEVSAVVDDNNPGKIEITYTLPAHFDSARYELRICWLVAGSTNVARTVDGDLSLAAGVHKVVWDAIADGVLYDSIPMQILVEVRACGNYCVVDLSHCAQAAHCSVIYMNEAPLGGFNTNEYKTNKLVLKRISAGTFIMGDDQKDESHRVVLTQDFYLGIFELTQKQWSLVTGSNPSHFSGDVLPVEQVSYDAIRGSSSGAQWPTRMDVDSTSFLGKLQAKTGLRFDLPTEAQWEYACRAGTTTTYSYGNRANGDYMWATALNSGNQTHPVGMKLENPWGLYDMHGNVAEWCLNWFSSLVAYGEDPFGALSGTIRVLCGGSWYESASWISSSWRGAASPASEFYSWGFRLCRTLPLSDEGDMVKPGEVVVRGVSPVSMPTMIPSIDGDIGAIVMGDAVNGFVVKPSVELTSVSVTIPPGVVADKVVVEVSANVQFITPNGAKIRVVNGLTDITPYLNIPKVIDGVVNLGAATIRPEIVAEVLDVTKDAVVVLGTANPILKTTATRPGLTYRLKEGVTLEEMKDNDTGDFKVGDGQPWTPKLKVKGGDSGFYTINVSK